MLELSDEDFKKGIIKMLQQAITNMIKTNEKMEHLSKQTDVKSQMEIRTEKCNNQIKQIKWAQQQNQENKRGKKICELGDRTIEITQTEQERKETEKNNRGLGICGIAKKIKHSCHQSPRRKGERERVQDWKSIWGHNG